MVKELQGVYYVWYGVEMQLKLCFSSSFNKKSKGFRQDVGFNKKYTIIPEKFKSFVTKILYKYSLFYKSVCHCISIQLRKVQLSR